MKNAAKKQNKMRSKLRRKVIDSRSILSRRGPLGAIWLAAYCHSKLKKAHVFATDISSSVDKILQDEFSVVTYRLLAYLLLGIVRIYSIKVGYLFDDCNEVLHKLKNFVVCTKDSTLMQPLRAPYFSITLPESFELDAFDLGILEDTDGSDVVSLEDITLKEGLGKAGMMGHFTLNKNNWEEKTCSANYTMVEDRLDFHMEVCTSKNVSNLKDSTKKLLGSNLYPYESIDIECFCMTKEKHQDPGKPSGEGHQAEKGHVIDSNGMPVEASMQKAWEDSPFLEACVNLENFIVIEKEVIQSLKPCIQHHQSDGHQMNILELTHQGSEVHPAVTENSNLSDVEASLEKPQDGNYSHEDCVNMEASFTVKGATKFTRLSDAGHSSDTGEIHLSEVSFYEKGKSPIFTESHQLSVTFDATPQSKFPNASGATTPEFFIIRTPAAKEQARIRKRKCLIDDVIVFPNNIIKQQIENSTALVHKRRKAPCTAIGAWRACQNLHQHFLEPLIPCLSLELRSLLVERKLKSPESIEAAEPVEMFVSKKPTLGKSTASVVHLEKLDILESCVVGRSAEIPEHSGKSFVTESPNVDRLLLVNRKPLEKLNVSQGAAVGNVFEAAEPLESLDTSEYATQTAIAPETPTQHISSLRSFESPERHEAKNSDGTRFNCEIVDREPFPDSDQELDSNLMSKVMTSYEGDKPDNWGVSKRTRVMARCLHSCFLNLSRRKKREIVNLLQLLKERTKEESARLFYEILVLKSKGCINVKQENAYDDILVWKTAQWDLDCATAGRIHESAQW
uniref:Sister chromatid cohesion 1 protein 2 isoform X1 n=3 Tax=Rhizophora mucronata TaxID=61149 RepID=A0A2P2K3D7_RHIMU